MEYVTAVEQGGVDLEKFFRNIKLKEWFYSNKAAIDVKNTEFDLKGLGLKAQSNFVPPTNTAVIEAFIKAVKMDVEFKKKHSTKNFKHPNITKEEQKALKELIHDDIIIIKPTDKEGAVVVMDKPMYMAEINNQLGDTGVYKKLNGDPRFQIMNEIENCLKGALSQEIIDKNTAVLCTPPALAVSVGQPESRAVTSPLCFLAARRSQPDQRSRAPRTDSGRTVKGVMQGPMLQPGALYVLLRIHLEA
ncbi:unnamed protein product [Ranitomeya imitator]|uniref:Uncharacterized protein n=1 Tax=Ranitomeya imitator TaxID=111125 RepID=A0ABN9MQD6_9NEOB|nr:unnamed protein product [Ranitomeya imitator]